jgi:hypothetical protein
MGLPATVSDDAYLLTSNAARSLEYRITAEQAARFARELHGTGPASSVGAPDLYTARPSEFARLHPELQRPFCVASNCGQWAVEQVEQRLAGTVGRVGQPSITAVGEGGAVVPGTASLGRLMGLASDVEAAAAAGRPNPAAGMPGALEGAGPVAGSVSTGIRVLRVGGRVFLVVGVIAAGYEVVTAPPEEMARTAVGVGAGFAGGFAAGAMAGLVCGPGAPVCSVVAGLALGFAGALVARGAAEALYDAANPRPGSPVTDAVQMQATLEALQAAEGRSVCPSCHSSTSGRSSSAMTRGGLDTMLNTTMRTSPPRPGALTPDEIRMIRDYFGLSRPAGAR